MNWPDWKFSLATEQFLQAPSMVPNILHIQVPPSVKMKLIDPLPIRVLKGCLKSRIQSASNRARHVAGA